MKRNWVEAEWDNTLHRIQQVPSSEGGLAGVWSRQELPRAWRSG